MVRKLKCPRCTVAIFALFVSTTTVFAQQPEFRPEQDWKVKWHGQTSAIDVISKGKALKGYHFNHNYNRISEAPWNAIQTLLGAYFVASVTELLSTKAFTERIERLTIAQCRAVMSMLSSQQSLYEGHVVYQLDDWRASDSQWHKIWEQRPLVSSITRLEKKREAQVRTFLGMKVIPLRKVDNCETVVGQTKTFSIDKDYIDGFEISWTPDKSSRALFKKIQQLKTSGLLTKLETSEIDDILTNFELLLESQTISQTLRLVLHTSPDSKLRAH